MSASDGRVRRYQRTPVEVTVPDRGRRPDARKTTRIVPLMDEVVLRIDRYDDATGIGC